MPDPESLEKPAEQEVREISDRLRVILGNALIDEIDQAEREGASILAWQFGVLDALTKQLAGAVTACVTMVRRLSRSQSDFVVFRQRGHEQLEPAVLALMNSELAKTGVQQVLPWPHEGKRSGRA